MSDPNLQQVPRGNPKDGDDVENWVKEVFVAPEGYSFWARDYSGIEARYVGYFSGSRDYTWLAGLGVHAFLASHILKNPADLTWPEDQLKDHLKRIKEQDKVIYDKAKRTVHASNYMVSPRKLVYEYPEIFPSLKEARYLQDLYYDICPSIPKWHEDLCVRVDGTKKRTLGDGDDPDDVTPWTLGVCHAVNPFGYTHRFYNVLDWQRGEVEPGKWEWFWDYGEDAKRLISFLPQSTAAATIKRAAKRVWYEYPWVGQTMRLLIHDEILGLAKDEEIRNCLDVSALVMEAPIPQLPLDPSWGMGEYLTVGTEAKVGKTWATMKEMK